MTSKVHGIDAYRYLLTRKGGEDAIESAFPPGGLLSRVVIRDEHNRAYCSFPTWDAFMEWQERVPPSERAFHEVIFGAAPQRLKFDIDAELGAVDAIPEEVVEEFAGEAWADAQLRHPGDMRAAKIAAIMAEFIHVLADVVCLVYTPMVAKEDEDFVVLESARPRPSDKYSFHVVTQFVVANHLEAKGFTARLAKEIPAPILELVDLGVNASTQNFRLAGSAKPNSGRVLRVTTRFGTSAAGFAATTIAMRPGTQCLPRHHTQEAPGVVPIDGDLPVVRDLTDEDIRKVLAVVARRTPHHEYMRSEGSLLLFRRKRPSHCALCERTHTSDNTLMISLREVAAGPEVAAAWHEEGAPVPHTVVELCRRSPGKTRALGRVVITPLRPFDDGPKNDAPEESPRAETFVAARIEAIKRGEVNPHLASASRFEHVAAELKEVYSEPRMRKYPAVRTLAVKAPMGLGKSVQLQQYLEREYPDDRQALQRAKIRFVSFRQTFSKSAQRGRFSDFELYSDHTGNLDKHARLIVQVESLHRLQLGDAPEPIDLLILDEVESILGQFNSGLHRHLYTAFAVFQWMLATAERVVCLDANLGNRTFKTLKAMRGGPIHFHWNQHRRAAGDTYRFTANRTVWLDHLQRRLREGQRLVVPTNSKAEARAVEALVKTKFAGKKVRLYSSETPPSVKEKHFADVHAHWGDLDVLIYTPTVSAGVSFELKHFDALFGLFTSASCDVETARQMLGRVRDIASRDFVICLQGQGGANLPTTTDDIRRLVQTRRASLYREDIGFSFEYAPTGEVRYHQSRYFQLWLETRRVENLSRNNYPARFIDQVADTGAAVEPLEPLDKFAERCAAIRRGHSEAKAEIAAAHHSAVAEAPDLCDEEVAEIRERVRQQQDVEPEERCAVQKHYLRRTFDARAEITPEFVRKYLPPGVGRVFRNLRRITAYRSVDEALRQIQADEQAFFHIFMETCRSREDEADFDPAVVGDPVSAIEARDLGTRYVFPKHRGAVCLLRHAGFRCITDRSLLSQRRVYDGMKSRERAFLASVPEVAAEFGTAAPGAALEYERDPGEYVRKTLLFANRILRRMYGIEVARTVVEDREDDGDDDADEDRDAPDGGETAAYYIKHTPVGRLFAFANDPRCDPDLPLVFSNLDPVDVDDSDFLFQLDTGEGLDDDPGDEDDDFGDDGAGLLGEYLQAGIARDDRVDNIFDPVVAAAL